MKRSTFVAISLPSIAALLATGCAFGTQGRIYATPGNDIALTRYDEAARAAGTCSRWKESNYAVELAGRGKGPEDGAGCVSFEIHENVLFGEGESIDLQEYLREEFGTGYKFGSVSVKVHIGFLNWLANVCTLGIANSRTITITGDRYPLVVTSSAQ
jgi:hypothetical protein